MQHLEPAEAPPLAETLDRLNELGEVEAEGTFFSARLCPLPSAFGGKLDPHADDRLDPEGGRALLNDAEFVRHLKHQHHPQAHELSVEGEVDEFLILVAVADEERVGIFEIGESRHQFGFASDFESVMKATAISGDLFRDLLLLVHLDREDAAIGAAVFQIADGLGEAVIEFLDAALEDAGKTKEQRRTDPAGIEFVEQLRDANRMGRARGAIGEVDDDLTPARNGIISGSPVIDAVGLGGLFDRPGILGSLRFRFLRRGGRLLGAGSGGTGGIRRAALTHFGWVSRRTGLQRKQKVTTDKAEQSQTTARPASGVSGKYRHISHPFPFPNGSFPCRRGKA